MGTKVETYRRDIIAFFSPINRDISKILSENIEDLNFPFKTAYIFFKEGGASASRILSFLNSCSTFHLYKQPVLDRQSFNLPSRGDYYLKKFISENSVNSIIDRFSVSTYIAKAIVKDLTENSEFNWFISEKERPGSRGNEYIIVDTMNLFFKIKQHYNGKNKKFLHIKNNIIGNRLINDCIKEFVEYISSNLNGNKYRLIFVCPKTKIYPKHYLSDNFYIVSVDCLQYLGVECSSETSSNETDDCVLILIYDYLFYKKNYSISILSGDNYGFSIISHDFFRSYDRALITVENGTESSTMLSWEDLTYENPAFTFEGRTLSIFEEEL